MSDCALTLLEESRRHLNLMHAGVGAAWSGWCLAKRSVDAYDFVDKIGYGPRMNLTWPNIESDS